MRAPWLLSGIENLLFPRTCFLCAGEPLRGTVFPAPFLCRRCAANLRLCGPENCERCGEFGVGAPGDRERLVLPDYCPRCSGRTLAFDRCGAGAAYAGSVRALVRRLKFSGARRAAFPLGRLACIGAERALRGDRPAVVTAVPLHPIKRLRRGYNQAELIAAVVARRTQIPFRTDLVRRARNTPSQGASSGMERRANLVGAFRPGAGLARIAARVAAIGGLHVLLVDDVISTATTVDECARALKSGGARRVTAVSAAT